MAPTVGRSLGLVGALLALAACTTALPPQKTTALGGEFNEKLKEDYLDLAAATRARGDLDTFHFEGKARGAMLGDLVWPDQVGSRAVPEAARTEVLVERDRLIDLLVLGGREQAPEKTARAQVAFDCWLEELDGAAAAGDSQCRTDFVTAMDEARAAMVPPDPTYLVLFESGSQEPVGPQRNTVTTAARAAQLTRPSRIDVIGYADPSGAPAQNEALSLGRAQTVAGLLVEAGVPPELINVQGRGVGDQGTTATGRRVEIAWRG